MRVRSSQNGIRGKFGQGKPRDERASTAQIQSMKATANAGMQKWLQCNAMSNGAAHILWKLFMRSPLRLRMAWFIVPFAISLRIFRCRKQAEPSYPLSSCARSRQCPMGPATLRGLRVHHVVAVDCVQCSRRPILLEPAETMAVLTSMIIPTTKSELRMAHERITEKRPPRSVGFESECLLQTTETAAIIQIHPQDTATLRS